jgi:hypothetical protein
MKLLPKFALLSIGVAAVPLAIAGYSSSRISHGALREALFDNELMIARQAAEFATSHLGNLHSMLGIETRILDLARSGTGAPSDEIMRKFLQLVYHQSDEISGVVALDGDGRVVAQPAFQKDPRPNDTYGNHEAFRPEDVALIPRLVPMADVLHDGAGIGPVFLAGPS